jgi:hypothetical protein
MSDNKAKSFQSPGAHRDGALRFPGDAWRAEGAREAIARAKARSGSTSYSATIVGPASVAPTPVQAAVPVLKTSDWLEKLDEGRTIVDCPLNTAPFLDLAGYLTALHSDNPQTLFSALQDTAEKIITAQNIIDRMLKQRAGKSAKL